MHARLPTDPCPSTPHPCRVPYVRRRAPPRVSQVNLKTSTAVFLLKPPQRVESAQPLAIHGCEPFAERRDFDTQLLAKLIRRHK